MPCAMRVLASFTLSVMASRESSSWVVPATPRRGELPPGLDRQIRSLKLEVRNTAQSEGHRMATVQIVDLAGRENEQTSACAAIFQ